MARILEKYKTEVIPSLKEEFAIKNDMQVPSIEKIVINMGVGKALQNSKRMDEATQHLTAITGQKPVVCRAKKSVATWRLRQGNVIGCKVTLRGKRMWEFYDRLVALAIPRIKDFRGLNVRGFDGRGNYTFGLGETTVFPEVRADLAEFTQGMDISIVTSAENNMQGFALLKGLGFPFRNDQKVRAGVVANTAKKRGKKGR